MNTKIIIYLLALLPLAACQDNEATSDAYGKFEAREVIISAEASGKLIQFDVEEGQQLKAGELVGLIDTTLLHLQREQLRAKIRAVTGKTQDAEPQVRVLQERRQNLLREERRLKALIADKAAPAKQLDDLQGQLEVIDKEIDAIRAQSQTANRGILSEIAPIEAQIEVVEEQIRRSYIYNPVSGTVLLQLAEPYEMTAAGKPLYTIAPLEELELRAYVSGAQLPELKLGQEVTVLVDQDAESNRSLSGTISWIADEAEFTPKTVQTKEERVNLVYAFKVKVKNDGRLKMGMPGEVVFQNSQQ
ncbi:HlyD family secretion protein [Phaeodactylibacter xiamenensis]|jgi:HlyD family secretion protein|uniref:HlyD family secretion protein n=1 Tax=Phaeodactylibacter xiamenensis TaxID=1524460 RepID=UPI0024A8CBB4|nr:HlyD family efflux transporter periplasmic adaptor subunit [Phaeodactylibacter xiamenensis]